MTSPIYFKVQSNEQIFGKKVCCQQCNNKRGTAHKEVTFKPSRSAWPTFNCEICWFLLKCLHLVFENLQINGKFTQLYTVSKIVYFLSRYIFWISNYFTTFYIVWMCVVQIISGHVTNQRQLCHFTAVHKPCPLASLNSNASFGCTFLEVESHPVTFCLF